MSSSVNSVDNLTVELNGDKTKFNVKISGIGQWDEPNTSLLFPLLDGDCCDFEFCEKCENVNTFATPVNMFLLRSVASEIADFATDDRDYIKDFLPPLAKNQKDGFYTKLIERFERIGSMVEEGKIPVPECTADEIALYITTNVLNERGLNPGYLDSSADKIISLLPSSEEDGEFSELFESLVQDLDILFLYDMSFDGIESVESFGIVNLLPATWFDKF
jgi:hypothetical protein